MSMIVTRCPRTWREISTGIDTDPDSFRSIPDVPSPLRCPVCGVQHTWRKSQSWLAHEKDLKGAA
jgi:hypothetical protein